MWPYQPLYCTLGPLSHFQSLAPEDTISYKGLEKDQMTKPLLTYHLKNFYRAQHCDAEDEAAVCDASN